ncbi:hypothetical protein [Psychrobacillus sp.]|uniref:hypothetical protein n=1 Tax=Psychrobacillus sp. TaxID=1871623 RepID=UPI0028BF5406|nr:hypothetical protein [Psychrobacillus sp.]
MKFSPEKMIYIVVPIYLLFLVFGQKMNDILYSILSFVLGITMLVLAVILLRKQLKARKKS